MLDHKDAGRDICGSKWCYIIFVAPLYWQIFDVFLPFLVLLQCIIPDTVKGHGLPATYGTTLYLDTK